ncbi:type VI secretion system Vgr family protein [Ralstonia pseudosolanacearum]|uniref:type VI secretion system Vgr family protein n=1 Tax=Ralstonia pseudosolanacearum TaxID=1310165 RepID=UPI003369C14D
MNLTDLLRAFTGVLDQNHRSILLDWGRAQDTLGQVLVPQYIDITEGLCTGIEGHVTCLSARPDLPLPAFLGLPLSVQLVTDTGALQPINGIITDVRAGQSDGSLGCFQLTIRDALAILEQRVNSRTFRSMSVPKILEMLLRECQQRSPALARAFDFELLLDRDRYPEREQTRQADESDAAFIRRLCRREGIFWFVQAGKRDGSKGDTPVHTLVFCDDPMKLSQSPAGSVQYHSGATVKERDSILLWSAARTLVPGSVRRSSWDYKTGQMAQNEQDTVIDQGEAGNDLAQLLADVRIDVPHAGDSGADYERLTKARILAHEHRAECVHVASDVRNLPPGFWFKVTGHPEVDTREEEQRQFIVASLHHRAANNFPKELGERAQALFVASRWQFDVLPTGDDNQARYENTFICVRRGLPLTPAFDPRIDLPAVYPFTARVVGKEGEEVHCDEYGRIKVQILALNPDDHSHAQGAGTSGTDRDGAWVRWVSPWAGPNYGVDMLPRAGMEVLIGHLHGDPDKMIVIGVLHSGPNRPATFSHTGSLPGNRYLSGIKTKEIQANRYNQLRFDDTPGEISSQLASEHTYTQLNLGYLTQPRDDGKGEPRGDGLEARTDAQVAVRGGKGVYVSAQAQTQAADKMLERATLQTLIDQLQELVQNLGDASAAHQADNTDLARINKISQQIKNWDAGSNVNRGGANGGAPMVAIEGPAGVTVASQDALVLGAQSHIDAVSAGNTQISVGRRLLMRAGEWMSAFAAKGMKLITAEGNVQIEAHKEDIIVKAAKRIVVEAGEEIIFRAPKVTTQASEQASINGGSSFSQWSSSSVVHGTSGVWREHAASHSLVGPDNKPVKAPDPLAYKDLKQKESLAMVLRSHPDGGRPLANEPYALYKGKAKVADGVTDEHGQLIIPDHQKGTPSYTVKLHNGHEIELPVKEELEAHDDQLAAQGWRAAQGDPQDRLRHAQS